MTVNEEIKNNNIGWSGIKYYPLSVLFYIRHGYTPRRDNLEYWINGTIPWFTIEDVRKNGRILTESIEHITPSAFKGKLFPKDSILISRVGTVGEPAILAIDGLVNDNTIAMTVKNTYKDKIIPKFAFYYGFILGKWCKSNSIGSVLKLITIGKLKKFKFPLIPIETQKKIVDFLDKKVNAIDRSLKHTKDMINDLVELRKSYPNELVVNAKGQKYRLAYLLKERSIRNRPEMQLLSVVREKGVIVRNVNDPNENHNYIPDDLSGYKVVEKDQFVINKMKAWQGSYGVSKYDGIVSPAYFIFDLFVKNKQFFNVAIRTRYYIDQFAKHSYGIRVGQWDLSKDELKKTIFYLPSEEKQKEIGEKGTRVVENIDRLLEILRKKVKVLEELKQSLIFEVVTGRRDVRDVL